MIVFNWYIYILISNFEMIMHVYTCETLSIYSLNFIIDDILESYRCFKIHDVLYFLISLKFIENCVTNDVL